MAHEETGDSLSLQSVWRGGCGGVSVSLAHLLWKSGLPQEPDSPGEFLRPAEAAGLSAINLQVLLEHDFVKST